MIRWLYSLFVHCHPAAFRSRFGDQMLSIFDESHRERGGFLFPDRWLHFAAAPMAVTPAARQGGRARSLTRRSIGYRFVFEKSTSGKSGLGPEHGSDGDCCSGRCTAHYQDR